MTAGPLARLAPIPSGRPLWLATLADLGLLLIGFFVFLQANAGVDGAALANGLRRGFVATSTSKDVGATAAMPVAVARVERFHVGCAALATDLSPVADWARDSAVDPRTMIRLAGAVDGSADDVDPVTGSAALLANDRARAVAVALISRGVLAPGRIVIDPPAARNDRSVTLTLGFAGDVK